MYGKGLLGIHERNGGFIWCFYHHETKKDTQDNVKK